MESIALPAEQYLTVSELSEVFNQTFSDHLPVVRVQGELSQCTRSANGHWYMTLKDDSSQVSLVAWRSTAARFSFVPEHGMAVLCVGKPNVYAGSGRLQIVVQRLQIAGEGVLQQEYLRLKEKLEREGLFRQERKRELPFFPKAIGVVTSSSGAVIHDIMTKIRERLPSMPVFLIDVRVQGSGAAEEIAAGVAEFNKLAEVDVIIVARGGGSLEDLWAFNEEVVARAIAASRIPVVSGVGHESDVTLSDLAADVRAPTPTAAAEMVVPKRAELLEVVARYEKSLLDLDRWFYPLHQRVDEVQSRLDRAAERAVSDAGQKVRYAQSQLQQLRPTAVFALFHARISMLERTVRSRLQSEMSSVRLQVDRLAGILQRISPKAKVVEGRRVVEQLDRRLFRGVTFDMKRRVDRVSQLESRVRASELESVLRRGFSLVRSADGKTVSSVEQLEVGAQVEVLFAKGRADALIQKIKNEKS